MLKKYGEGMIFFNKKLNIRIRKSLVFLMFKKIKQYLNYKDNSENLIYIHIGKCGGLSLNQAINQSEIIKNKFTKITKIHLSKPPILKKARYLIVVRNPIRRSLSAFNWRYKHVVEGSLEKGNFIGDQKVLKKYGSLNNLAECLYDDGNLNINVAKEFKTIRHLKEDISYYLRDLLNKIKKEQIFCVFITENLSDDISKYLEVKKMLNINENSINTHSNKKHLSDKAYRNLKIFLNEEFEIIEKLFAISDGANKSRKNLLRYKS